MFFRIFSGFRWQNYCFLKRKKKDELQRENRKARHAVDVTEFINCCCYSRSGKKIPKTNKDQKKGKSTSGWLLVRYKQLLWGIILLLWTILTTLCLRSTPNQILHLNFSRPPWAWQDRGLHVRLHQSLPPFWHDDHSQPYNMWQVVYLAIGWAQQCRAPSATNWVKLGVRHGGIEHYFVSPR